MATLLRRFLASSGRPITGIVALQLVSTLATLYLPTLNADIIDRGIAQGDTAYIVRLGGVMLVISLVQVIALVGSVRLAAAVSMGMGRDLRGALFPGRRPVVAGGHHVRGTDPDLPSASGNASSSRSPGRSCRDRRC